MERSTEVLERAAALYASDGERESEQFARLAAASSKFAIHRAAARAEVAKILSDPVSQPVRAEAHLLEGGMYEVLATAPIPVPRGQAINTEVQRMSMLPRTLSGTALARVLQHFRTAYELSSPGSVTEATARAALERLDKSPLPPKQAAEDTLAIVAPGRAALTGEAVFLIQAPAAVARVDVFLDEKQVAGPHPDLQKMLAWAKQTKDTGPVLGEPPEP